MTQLQFLTGWVTVAAGVAFWTCALWPAVICWFWPWWRHEWGLNMVIKTELIALGLLATVLHREFGVTSPYVLLWTTAVAVTLIPAVVAWRTWIIWRVQRDGARDAARDPGAAPLRLPGRNREVRSGKYPRLTAGAFLLSLGAPAVQGALAPAPASRLKPPLVLAVVRPAAVAEPCALDAPALSLVRRAE